MDITQYPRTPDLPIVGAKGQVIVSPAPLCPDIPVFPDHQLPVLVHLLHRGEPAPAQHSAAAALPGAVVGGAGGHGPLVTPFFRVFFHSSFLVLIVVRVLLLRLIFLVIHLSCFMFLLTMCVLSCQ